MNAFFMPALRFLAMFVCMCAFMTTSAISSQAAARKAPPLKEMGGQKVSTPYFDLVIPQGWSMPVPVKNMPQQGITTLFADMRGEPAVTISVMKSGMTARQIGEQTIANMKSNGIEAGDLKENDGLYCSSLTGKVKGHICFGSHDGVTSAINIVGNEQDRANVLLEALQPKTAGLFPKSVGE